MNKKRLGLIIGILGILIVLISAKSMIKQPESKSAATQPSDLKAQYLELKNAGKPVMIVFSYDADC